MSASQRRVQPALNTEDRRASILLWLFSLIAAHPPAEMLLLQMFGVIVPHLQFQSSGCFPTISEESARTEAGWEEGAKLQFVAAKWEIEKRAIMIHAPAPIYGPTGPKKDWFLCCF